MRYSAILLIAALAVCPGVAAATSYNLCREDHSPPPTQPPIDDKIGEVAGFQVLGLFLSLGGFDCPQAIMTEIQSMNAEYQTDEYLPRYEEAAAIHDWIDATHDVYNEGEDPPDCPVCGSPHNTEEFRALVQEKLARRNEISAEIDAIWAEYALDAWEMVPEASRDAYLDWCDSQDGE
jgi:hypothetical protein